MRVLPRSESRQGRTVIRKEGVLHDLFRIVIIANLPPCESMNALLVFSDQDAKRSFVKLSNTVRVTRPIIKDESSIKKRALCRKNERKPNFFGICFVGVMNIS